MRSILLFFTLLPLISLSQISIVSSDMPAAGDTLRTSATVNLGGYDFEATGPEYDWDFSELYPFYQTIDTFVSVSETPLVYQLFFFFTANLAQQEFEFDQFPGFEITDSYRFYKNNSSSFNEVGFGVTLNGIPLPTLYDDADIIYKFPVEAGNADSSVSNYEFDVPFLGYYGGWKKRVNEVDGWGTITTPFGSFDALRMKTNVYQYDSLYIDSLGFGFPIYQENTVYRWLAEDQGLPVLEVTDNGLVQTVTYLDSVRTLLPVSTPKALSSAQRFYPNPCKDHLFVQTNYSSGTPYRIELYSYMGRQVYAVEGVVRQNPIKLDLVERRFLSGAYILKLITPDEVVTQKIVIQH